MGGAAAGLREDLWVMTSGDLGDTWSQPMNITSSCSTPYGGGVTPSGGHGIQLQLNDGRASRAGAGAGGSGGARGNGVGSRDHRHSGAFKGVKDSGGGGGGQLIVPLYAQGAPPALSGQGICRSTDHGGSWHASGRVTGNADVYDGPYEGELVELFGKTAENNPR